MSINCYPYYSPLALALLPYLAPPSLHFISGLHFVQWRFLPLANLPCSFLNQFNIRMKMKKLPATSPKLLVAFGLSSFSLLCIKEVLIIRRLNYGSRFGGNSAHIILYIITSYQVEYLMLHN
jgi:hypothetical protein